MQRMGASSGGGTSGGGSSAGGTGGLPLGTRVHVSGLQSAAQYNGKMGVVKGFMTKTGRQSVFIEGFEKEMLLKPANMKPETRTANSLSIKELKAALAAKQVPESRITGMDKAGLVKLLGESVAPDDELSVLVALGSVEQPGAALSAEQMRDGAQRMASMNPEQMRSQARMIRSMTPDQVRRSNPQMRHFTDTQIKEAADQLEQMAANPEMMRMAAEQMKNMTPAQIEDMRKMAAGGGGAGMMRAQADQLAAMDPATLRANAKAMRGMPPDMVRRSNPQMANFTDTQIKEACNQMEQMAENPEMLKAATEQMKNMDPAQVGETDNEPYPSALPHATDSAFTIPQLAEMQKMMAGGGMPAGGLAGFGGGPGGMPTDASALANMDPKQIKAMVGMMKSNPAMLKSMMKMIPGGEKMKEEDFLKQVDMIANMDESQLKTFLSYAGMAQKYFAKARAAWQAVDAALAGQLLKIVVVAALALAYLFAQWLFFRPKAGAPPPSASSLTSGGMPTDAFAGADLLADLGAAAGVAATAAKKTVAAAVGASGEVDEFDS
jgi:hypothetical protein